MHLIRRLSIAALLLTPASARSQSLLDRSPNVSGDWVGAPGTLYFHFVHRFTASDGPEKKVSNVPTFLLAAGLPKRLLAGFNYSTNSNLAPRFPNEWEVFARWAPISQDYGAPLDLGGQIGYNNAADGVDGEVSIAKKFGIARLIIAGRALSDPLKAGNARFAAAGGATIKLGQYFALAGDIASLTNRDSSERVAWSAGVHFAIPLTPHTVSLQATNAPVATLQGASRGTSTVRYGFEFTIPLTLRRYFGKRAESSPDSATTGAADSTVSQSIVPSPEPAVSATVPSASTPVTAPKTDTARVPTAGTAGPVPAPRTNPPARTTAAPVSRPATPGLRPMHTGMKNITYLHTRLQVALGTTVEWTNNDPLPHSVTATDKSFNSGLIQPGKTYRHTFTKAGTFNFYCMPHPFMKGAVVVKAP